MPKITDFGLAKHMDAELAQTRTGAVFGTPSYMAPEQAVGDTHAIGPATDIFALGVVLYEMLTGRVPFRGTTVLDTLDLVRLAETVPPSKLQPKLPRDLETICLKCLRREPRQRYASAAALADDLRRFLDGRPIAARRAGWPEQAVKWAKRRPAVAALSAGLTLVVAGAFAVVTWLWRAAEYDSDRARTAETQAQRAADEAEQRAAETRAMVVFLNDKLLAAARPQGQAGGLGKDVTLKAALDQAAQESFSAFPGRPLVEARIQMTLAETYFFLGDYSAGERHARRAWDLRREQLGSEEENTLAALFTVAGNLLHQGKKAEAETLLRQCLAGQRRVLGPEHAATLKTMTLLAAALDDAKQGAEIERLQRQALEAQARVLGSDHADALNTQHNLAATLRNQGKIAESEALYRQCLEAHQRVLGPDHPHTLECLLSLGQLLQGQGRLSEAEAVFRQCLEGKRRVLPIGHPDLLSVLANLAYVVHALGKLADAEPLYREVTAAGATLGSDNPTVHAASLNLISLLQGRRKLAEAEQLLRQLLDSDRRRLPAGHPDLGTLLSMLGGILNERGQSAEAESLLREALAIRRKALPPDAWPIANTQSLLGDCLAAQQRYTEAEPLLLQGYEGLTRSPDAPPIRLREALVRIVKMYERWDKKEQAENWRRQLPAQPEIKP